MRAKGQVVVIVAIALTAILGLLAVAVDGGRLYIQRNRLNRRAQSAADAGIGWVAEQMVTLAVPRQTEAAGMAPCVPDGDFGESGARCTATPRPAEIPHWLNDDDRATLVSPQAQATVEAVGREYAARNGLVSTAPEIEALAFTYPYAYDPDGPTLSLRSTVRQRARVLLVGLLGTEFARIERVGQADVPQR